MFRRLQSEKGMSLAELMVAVAIMGTITMAMMSMMDSQMKSLYYIEDKMAVMNLKSDIKQRMLDPKVCDATLRGLKIPELPANFEIKDNSGKVLYSSTDASTNKYDHVKIENISLRNNDVPDHMGAGWVDLVIKTSRMRKGTGPSVFKPIVTPLRVSVNASQEIINCDTGRVTALDCGQHPHGKILTTFEGECPNRIRKRDLCIGGIWLLYEKRKDPDC